MRRFLFSMDLFLLWFLWSEWATLSSASNQETTTIPDRPIKEKQWRNSLRLPSNHWNPHKSQIVILLPSWQEATPSCFLSISCYGPTVSVILKTDPTLSTRMPSRPHRCWVESHILWSCWPASCMASTTNEEVTAGRRSWSSCFPLQLWGQLWSTSRLRLPLSSRFCRLLCWGSECPGFSQLRSIWSMSIPQLNREDFWQAFKPSSEFLASSSRPLSELFSTNT